MSEQPQASADFQAREQPPAPEPQQTAAAAPAAPDSRAVLEQLRQDLAKAEADAQSAGTRTKSLKADLAALEKALQDVDKSAEAYEKAHAGLAQQLTDCTKYAEDKYKIIVGAVGDKKDDVDAAGTWFEQREAEAVEAVRKTGKEHDEAEKAYAERQAAAKNAQDEYAAAKDRVRTLNDDLKAVVDLQKDLEKAEDKSDKILMYATVVELRRLIKRVPLKPAADYRSELDQRWFALNAAQQALREADQKRADAAFTAAQAKQTLTGLRANRVDRIVDHANENPVPPPPNNP